MKAIRVSLCPETGIPLVPEEIKERVRNGEKISIELMHGTQGFVKNALRHGCAGLWIDGCRIPTQEELGRTTNGPYVNCLMWNKTSTGGQDTRGVAPKGRYPKNIIIDSSEEVLAEFVKAGVRKSGDKVTRSSSLFMSEHDNREGTGYTETNTSAARYFKSCPSDPIPSNDPCIGCVECLNDDLKPKGRYPKNILIDGSEEIKAEFAKAGVRKSGGEAGMRNRRRPGFLEGLGPRLYAKETSRPPDTGFADRYFQTCPPDPCPTCNGAGVVEIETSFGEFMNNPYEPPPEYEACPDCVVCHHCMDTGVELPDGDMINDEWLEYAKEYPCPECRAEEPVRFLYKSKSSKRERIRGFDTTCTVKYNIPNNILKDGISCKDVNTVLVVLLRKVTLGLTISWNIEESGANITGRSQWDSLSITLTEINKITESKIWNLLMHLPINEFIVDANCERGNGGNHVENVECLKQFRRIITNANQESVRGAKRVVSEMLLTIKEKENWQQGKNSHNTVKPLSLVRYLCKISQTPTGGIVLDPFLGSGTTSLAAFLEGRASIGIEQSAKYCEIAVNRLAYEQSLDPADRVKDK